MKLNWAKLAIFVFTVLLPAIAVGISNWYVFRDSFVMATILLVITVGVAAVTTYYSGAALDKIRRYCLIFDLLIGVVLCINLTSHFLLAREVSAAKEAVEDRHIEEERHAVLQKKKTEQAALLLERQATLLNAQRDALRMEAVRNDAARKAGVRPGSGVTLPPMPDMSDSTAEQPTDSLRAELDGIKKSREAKPPSDPDAVKRAWNPWLTFWAFVDVFIAVIGGLTLASLWQWDRNNNGIPDDEEEEWALPEGETKSLPNGQGRRS